MRSRLTALLTVVFLSVGAGGALALNGGADLGLGADSRASASFAQYRPAETPPVTVPPASSPPATAPAATVPPAPAPPTPQPAPVQAVAVLSTHGVATVSCSAGCQVVLLARHGSHLVHVTATLNANGTATIHLSKRELRRLGRGPVVVSVTVDGHVIAKRRVIVS